MPYFLIIALQGFCIYHAFKNNREYYWYFLIVLLPVIGCIIYLVTQVFNKRDLDVVQKEIVSVVNPTKKVNDLKKQVEFADTFQNRVFLGDALYEIKDYNSGIGEYEIALNGKYKSDSGVVKKLLEGYYQTSQFDKVIFCAEQINEKIDFKGSRSQFLYGLALGKQGRNEEAKENLKPIDQRYSNYEERYILAQFLINQGKIMDGKEILSEIILESQHMSKPNRHKYRRVVNDVKKLIESV
ncbi:hypothetical protein SAMN04487910_3218 [Aquimarina amphilecti]|uniref:Cardiolipin synthase N-terminal domain-containing protein n=1 Tax=Aquimarina amphilecti TaxID=1038014 RepID=A0A1H7SZT3_AQUAM|nr:hypothetical protein [Aquimarina amphilecti]SEL77739.1 hypothetical protein SAMN04487910_3218 [Aquimarina amphilecti]